MQSEIFQGFIWYNFTIMAYSLWKPQIQNLRKLEYCEKVQ